MLVLSRHRDEEILINPGTPDEIRIMVISVDSGKARIGVEAPRRFPVHRKEIWDAIQRERESQSQ